MLRSLAPPLCDHCGRSLDPGETVPDANRPPRCGECRKGPPALTAARSVAALDGPLRRAVHRLKYRGRPAAAGALAELMLPLVPGLGIPAGAEMETIVLPVPLHPSRQQERGYNQAALLARPLAGRLGLPCRPHLIRRRRRTAPQVGLSRVARRENVRGAFLADPAVAGCAVLLVDDVTTTGSTLTSASGACLGAGARAVYALTLAREL
jgi:ComF family protein